jgi:tetratricopeptide (TPR) repeat protein
VTGIFISYRRDDSAGHAGRIFDRLAARFGADQVFLDVGAIPPGADFVAAIEEAVTTCDVVIPVIGPRWASVTDAQARRRLDLDEDFVRLELQIALERHIPLIPLLVGGAHLPGKAELPEGIERIARLEALEISDHRFDEDTLRLIDSIERLRRTARAAGAQPTIFAEGAGSRADAPESSRQTRKVVTVVAVGGTDWTPPGEPWEPEKTRSLADERSRMLEGIVTRYGGSIDHSSGVVVALFGIPRLHEDDAERAIRAALEIHDALVTKRARADGLPVEGAPIPAIGIATGEVLVEEHAGGFTCTGTAMESAAMLSARGGSGTIHLSDRTHRLVGSVAESEEAPGDATENAVAGPRVWRLLGVMGGGSLLHRRSAQLHGRSEEIGLLEQSFQRSVRERSCHLFTVLGAPGVGKSRLVAEFLKRVDDRARTLTGRCLAYGEGITYWPVAEVIRVAADIPHSVSREVAAEKVDHLLQGAADRHLVGPRILQVLGMSEAPSAPEETFWAIRRFIEHLASDRPLVVVMEDVHWAEPTLLDLLDYVADWSSSAPVLLICVARNELLDNRPGWGGGKRNVATIGLEPLSELESDALIGGLLGSEMSTPELRKHITSTAEGNPLFVEETIAMLIDNGALAHGEQGWTLKRDVQEIVMPPTISALLAARVDQLGDEERDVLQRASVVGREFYRGAIEALSPPSLRSRIPIELLHLIHRELIRPAPSSSVDNEEGFEFRHILIRDVAYQALPKRLRAELHRLYAEWIERRVGDRSPEYEEIIGYHLEQASRYMAELGSPDASSDALSLRAGGSLARAGSRAFRRGDMPAAANLLSRAVALLPADGPASLPVLPELGEALFEIGDLIRSDEALRRAIEGAAAIGDDRTEAFATVVRCLLRLLTEPTGWAEEAQRAAERAMPVFEMAGDRAALAKTWELLHHVHIFRGQYADAEYSSKRAAEQAGLAGQEQQRARHLAIYAATSVFGPTPVDEGVRRCEDALRLAADWPSVEAQVRLGMGGLRAMQGDFAQARSLVGRARDLWTELGLHLTTASAVAQYAGFVEMLAGDWAAAERELRVGLESLERMGEHGVASSVAATLARVLFEQGRYGESERFAIRSEETAAPDDLDAQVQWRAVRGRLSTERGSVTEGVALIREALERAERTDDLDLQAGVRMDLGHALKLNGESAEAEEHISAAVALCERKGNLVAAGRARRKSEA